MLRACINFGCRIRDLPSLPTCLVRAQDSGVQEQEKEEEEEEEEGRKAEEEEASAEREKTKLSAW